MYCLTIDKKLFSVEKRTNVLTNRAPPAGGQMARLPELGGMSGLGRAFPYKLRTMYI